MNLCRQRPRRDAGRRAPHHRDRQRRARRGRTRGPHPMIAPGRYVVLTRQRHRRRHGRADVGARSSSRSSRPRSGAREPGSAWPRSTASSSRAAAVHLRLQRARARHDLQDLLSIRRARTGRRRTAAGGRAETWNRDDPGCRGRGLRAIPGAGGAEAQWLFRARGERRSRSPDHPGRPLGVHQPAAHGCDAPGHGRHRAGTHRCAALSGAACAFHVRVHGGGEIR